MATYYSQTMTTSMQYISARLELTVNSQNIANNTSNVTVKAWFWRNNSWTGDTYGTGTCYVTINGTEYSQAITPDHKVRIAGIYLFSKTLDISHGSDGVKTLSMALRATHEMFPVSSQSWSQALPTIPRTSSFTLSSSSVNAGSSVTLTISRASSSFTHKAYLLFGGGTWTIGTSIGTSQAYTIPNDTMNKIPNATSGTGTIKVETYNGSTKIGEASQSITINVPSSVVPSFTSLTTTRVANTAPSGWSIYVQSNSKCTVAITGATGSYGSTIKSYSISGGGYSSSSSSFTTGALNTSGTITFTGKITDSRGRTATKTASITVYEYKAPNISSVSVYRSNSGGTASDEGTYLRAYVAWTISSCNGANSSSAAATYSTDGGSTWTGSTAVTSGTAKVYGGGSISIDKSYKARIAVTDGIQTVYKYFDIPTASTTIDLRSGGKGVAIGKVCEADEFQVGMASRFYNEVHTNNNLTVNGLLVPKKGQYIHSAHGTSGTGGYVKIATFKVTGTYCNEPCRFSISQRGKSTITDFHIQFQNSGATDPGLSAFTKQSGSSLGYIVKSATSTWDIYINKTENYDEICVTDFHFPSRLASAITWTWTDVHANSLPSGYTEAKYAELNMEKFYVSENNQAETLQQSGYNKMSLGVTHSDSVTHGVVLTTENGKLQFRPWGDDKNVAECGTGSVGWADVWINGWSRSSTGYSKLTNSIIMQWGSLNVTQGTTGSVTFPLAFPNNCFVVELTSNYSNSYGHVEHVNELSKTGFKINKYNGNTTGLDTVFWLAIGY